MKLNKYSIGIGDRFAQQGKAQLLAILKAKENGIDVTPVWNKSYREHENVKSLPSSTRREADNAVKSLQFSDAYFVDADHVGMTNVDFFIKSSDFFTLDVADCIGKKAENTKIDLFVDKHRKYIGALKLPHLNESFKIAEELIREIAGKFLYGIEEAGRIYRHLLSKKAQDSFVIEVSMDETEKPQTPIELLFILAAIAQEGIPVQTIAPKFSGRFNKGVDYIGDLKQFAKEFEQDIIVINWAVNEFSLPDNLKLSVHSGSDKFSIYSYIREIIKKYDAGLHLKTAGTTWLEELIGLAQADDDGLQLAKEIYEIAFSRYAELCKPYATVIDVVKENLPHPNVVNKWNNIKFANTLKHDQTNKQYDPQFRQMLHVAYKVAAEMGDRYLLALKKYENIVAKNVTENIYERHLKPLFF